MMHAEKKARWQLGQKYLSIYVFLASEPISP